METLINQFKSFLLELPSSRQGGKKGLSKVSVKNYLSDIRRFLDWLSQYQPQISSAIPQRLNSDHFQAYLDFLTHQDLPHSTISRHFSSLRRFATFIEIIYHQPPLIIPSINSPDATPKPEPTTIQTSSPDLLSSFSSYLKDQQKSASTVRNYLSDIRHFLAWVDQHPELNTLPSAQQLDSSLESDVIDQYSHYLELTNTPSSTSSRRLSSLNIFTQFATNQGLISPKTKPETSSPRLKPIPALSWLKPKTSSGQGFNLNLPSFIKKPISRLTSSPAYRSYHQLPFTPYLHLALLVLFTSAFALFGFRQIIIQSERIAAYPSTPNRPTRQLSFQGRLTDSSGTPIVTPINATFKLWDQETGGTQGTCSGGTGEDCLYSTTTCSVDPDQDGIFNVLLGDGTCGSEIPADVFTENTAVWLEVEIAAETLTPRQPIATVAYALNSETVSGIPVSASGSATINTLFFMNSSGEIVLGEQNPSILADSGNFTLQGETLTLSTTPFSEGDITIAPDGIGQVNFIGGTTTDDFIRVVNANLTTGSLISGYVGNNSNTGELLRLSSGTSETDRFVVTTGGQTTIDALALGKSAFIVNQLSSGPIFTASASGTPVFTINNLGTITLANNSIITDDTNYTRFSRGIAVGGNETYYFNASGNINANNLTLSGTTTLNGLTYTWPGSQTTNYVLSTNGSGTLSWVDPAGAASATIYWTQSGGALYPKNATVDLLVGSNASASAIFRVDATTGNLVSLAGSKWMPRSDSTSALNIANAAGTSFVTFNTTSQRVGIGTTSPNNLLQVNDLISFPNADLGTRIGYQAGKYDLGQYNTWLGYQAGSADNATGKTNAADYNTGIGFQALRSNTTGYQNSAMGVNALYSNTTGYSNSAMGVNALYYNTTGNYNSAMGMQSLYSNTTGYNNSAMGMQALYSNTTGYSNSAMGVNTLYYNTTGYSNSAMGVDALYYNTTGYSNSAMGMQALYHLKPTSKAITAFADSSIEPGVKTTVTSAAHGQSNGTTVQISGTTNYNGSYSISNVTTDTFDITKVFVANDATGWWAIDSEGRYSTAVGGYAGYDITTGSNNTLLGYNTGRGITTGSSNTILGANVTGLAADLANTVVLADGDGNKRVWIDSSGNVGIGTTSPSEKLDVAGSATVSGNLTFTGSSSTIANRLMQPLTFGDSQTGDLQFYSSSNTLTSSGNLTLAGNLNLTSGDLQTGGTSRITNTGNLTNIGTTQFNNLTYTWPASQSTNYVLTTDGSGGLSWSDPAAAAASTIYWAQSGGALYPKNATVDLLVGSNASASAIFRVDATTGNLVSLSGSKWMPRSDSTSALNIANAAGTSFVTFNTTNQRVGIGTTSPTAKLEIGGDTGDGGANDELLKLQSNGDGGMDLTIQYNGTTNDWIFNTSTGRNYNFKIGATNVVYFDSTGLVGIGTTSPSEKLDVAGSATVSGNLTFTGSSSTIANRLMQPLTFGDSQTGDLQFYSSSNTLTSSGNLTLAGNLNLTSGDLQTGGTSRITNAGNLTNIGTTQFNSLTYTWPGSHNSSGYVLSNNGSGTLSWIDPAAAAAGSIYWTLTDEQLHPKNASWHDLMIGGTSTASAKFFAQANTGDGYFSGELGLGTTTPTAKLDIQAAPSVYTSEVGNIRISNASDTTEKLYLGYDNNLGTYGSGYIQSSKTSTTWLPTLINPNGGYVGINNTNPSRALHVEDNSGIYIGDGSKNIQLFTSGTDNDITSSHTLHLNYNSNQAVSIGQGGTSNLYISGSVGIGNTSPTSLFSVGSSSQFQVNTAGNIIAIGGDSHTIYNSSGNLVINSAGTLNIADTNIQLSGGSTTLDVYNNAADTTLTLNNSSATYRSHLSLEGQLKLGTYTSTPSGIAAGAVYYDTTLDRPYYFNGIGNWVPFSAGEGGDGSKWTITDGLLHPNNSSLDLTIGGSSTNSAAFAFTGISSSTRTATISGNLALSVPTGSAPTTSLDILNGGSFDIKTSVGGNAGLTSRLYISNDGKVGIGTTTPQSELHIPSGTIRTDGFVSESDWGSFGFNMYWDNAQSQWEYASNGYASLIQQDGTNGGLYIATAPSGTAGNLASWSRALTIDVDGNVGIGTDTPQAKLDITGASSTIANTSGDITINSASGKISFAGDSLNNFLHATASGQIKPGSYGSDPYPIGDGAIIYRSDLNQLNYYNGTSWQAIGSGSGSYWSEFDGLVYPTAYSVYDLAIGGDTTASAKFFVDHSTGTIKIADTTGTDFHTIANNGNNLKITSSTNGSKVILQPDLQINGGDILGSTGATRISLVDSLSLTSVSGFLAVDRAATISASLASDITLHLKGAASQTANYMAITSNGGSTGNILTVDSSGNVGIGDTSPSAKLDVAGSATISGTLAVGVMNQVDAGTCDAAAEGRIFYDKGVRLYKACTYNSSDSSYAWRPLGGLSDQHRRDVSTDSVVNNQVVRKGWTYGTGTGATSITATVSYGITFDDTPIVVAARAGTKYSSPAPTSLSECNAGTYYIEKGVQMFSIDTTGFSVTVGSGSGAYDTSDYVCFTWIAIGSYSSGYGADLAEYYLTHDTNLDAAEIVAIDPDNDIAVTKANPTTNPAVIGIVSTQAGAILGNKDGTTPGVTTSITGKEVESGSKTVPVALAGRVPVKVSLENGPIYRGDPLTLSPTLPGTAVKAITPGPIIGRALENFTGNTTIIDSLDQNQAINEQRLEKQAFNDLNQGIGKIMVFIQNSYHSPVMTASTATSSATITFDHQGNLINPNDSLLAQAKESLQTNPSFFDRFISLIVKNLTALNITSRSISTQELISPLVEADLITTNTLTTSLIKPQPDSDLILSLDNQSATTPSQLLITDNQNNTVASIDSSGNATFSGELTADSAKFDSLEVGSLKANQIEGLTDTLSQIKSASEAAQLFLDRLTAKHSAQDQSLNATAQQLVSTSSSQLLSTLKNNFTLDSDGTHLTLTGLSSDYAYFNDYLAVEGTLMTNDLYVENNLITSSISSPLDADDQTLYLQPTGTGAINLLAGLLVLDQSGTVSLNGNLIVTGTLESGSATVSGTLDLRAISLDNNEEATHSGFGRLLSVYNEDGIEVASVNASGSAQFSDLTTRQIIIAASQDSTQSASQASTDSNATIGTATIPAGELTTYIENNNISDSTLIYLTPISDTRNQVLYVKNKYSCPIDAPYSCQPFFTVAINQSTTQDIRFNYWLIQTQ